MDECAATNGSGWGKLESNEVDLFLVCRRHWTALMQVKDRCILLAYVLLVLPTSAGQQTAINMAEKRLQYGLSMFLSGM